MRTRRALAALGMWAALAVVGSPGCESNDTPPPATVNLFGPTAMRIHPIFTQPVAHDGKFDAVEAQLEFDDQFGDPTKASGKVLFELFTLRKEFPDPRGNRVAGPWVGSLQTLAEQYARWNTTLRTYKFELNDPGYRTDQSYVLTATFEKTSGGRFFDRIVLPAAPAKPSHRHSRSARGELFESLGPATAPAALETTPHEPARAASTRSATQPLEFPVPDPAAPSAPTAPPASPASPASVPTP